MDTSSLTKDDYKVIIECMLKQRYADESLLAKCMNTAYLKEFPDFLENRKQEVQKINSIIIKLNIVKNTALS